MNAPLKICPRCKTPAPLDAAFCGQCGRQYRTQFAPPASVAAPALPDAPSPFAESGPFPSSTPASPARWFLLAGIALLACLGVLYLAGRRSAHEPASFRPNPSASSPQATVPILDAKERIPSTTAEEPDPIVARAQREVEQAKSGLGIPPSSSAASSDGRVHLRSGGSLRQDEWDAARRKLQASPLFREPAAPPF